jgi:hypothetical protein
VGGLLYTAVGDVSRYNYPTSELFLGYIQYVTSPVSIGAAKVRPGACSENHDVETERGTDVVE